MKRSRDAEDKRPSRKKTTTTSTSSKSADETPAVDAKKSAVSELEEFTPEELSKMSRSERKRHREKKRRNDVNKGFEDLMNLLLEIDPSVRSEAEERSKRGQFKSGSPAAAAPVAAPAPPEENLLSRVDLITKTTEVLRRVHRENEDRKAIIEQLLRKTNETTQSIDKDGGVTLRSANGGIIMVRYQPLHRNCLGTSCPCSQTSPNHSAVVFYFTGK